MTDLFGLKKTPNKSPLQNLLLLFSLSDNAARHLPAAQLCAADAIAASRKGLNTASANSSRFTRSTSEPLWVSWVLATAGLHSYLGARPCGDDRISSDQKPPYPRLAHDNVMDGCANAPEQRFGRQKPVSAILLGGISLEQAFQLCINLVVVEDLQQTREFQMCRM